jgi:hypothetical protein
VLAPFSPNTKCLNTRIAKVLNDPGAYVWERVAAHGAHDAVMLGSEYHIPYQID